MSWLISTQPGWIPYELTQTDLGMLAKAAAFEEARHPDAVIWTYAQRFTQLRRARAGRLSLAQSIAEQSQPLNPRWRRDGSYCRPGGLYHRSDRYCGPDVLERRDRAARLRWDQLGEGPRAAALEFVAGRLENPVPGAVDFARKNREGTDTVTRFLARNPGAWKVATWGNMYLGSPATRRWTRGTVRVVLERPGAPLRAPAAPARAPAAPARAPAAPRGSGTTTGIAAVVAGVLLLVMQRGAR